MLESKITNLKAEYESIEDELNKIYLEEELKQQIIEKNREEITRMRRGTTGADKTKS
jgi:circadian clock protein KaiC